MLLAPLCRVTDVAQGSPFRVLVVPSIDIRLRSPPPAPPYPVRLCNQEQGDRLSYVTLVTSNKYVYGAVALLHSLVKTGAAAAAAAATTTTTTITAAAAAAADTCT